MEEINATLGIDLEKATPEQALVRLLEFAEEQADAYSDKFDIFVAFNAIADSVRTLEAAVINHPEDDDLRTAIVAIVAAAGKVVGA